MGAIKKLYMCKMHNILYFDKNKGNKPGKKEGKKTTKKCRIEAETWQEKGLHMAETKQFCCGNDTGQSDLMGQTRE